MRLINLTANKPTFHPVDFRRAGVSLIVGAQKDPSSSAPGQTYNGVGKSLLVALVHFCLGSDKNQEFAHKLPEWQFILRFEHRGVEYRVSRSTGEQNKITFDGEELKVTDYRVKMEQLMFSLPEPKSYLTFRSLISRFIRPRKESYNAFDRISSQATPYQALIQNAFLLGLNTDLVAKKYELRTEQERIKKLRENLSKDSIFRDFFTGDRNPDIELADLESKIARLRANLAEFRVAEDYHERQRDADQAARALQTLRNELVVVRNSLSEIERSLIITPDIPPSAIVKVFEEANAALPDQVCRRVEEVAAFHNSLMQNRVKRLTAEQTVLENRVDRIERDITLANQSADDLRRFLGSHGALDEFVAMTERLNDVETKAQKLRDYQSLLAQYSDKTQELTAEMSTQTIRTNKYLRDAKPILDGNMERFRSLSQRFYGDRPGGLTVKNNEGENQSRFDIDARIEDDAADGINEVKIFCYDMTLLTQRHNHSIDFLFHDSRLFSDVDIRQRSTIFKIAHELTSASDYQYIATLNQDHIEAMRSEFTPEEFTTCIEDAIVLRLTDESPTAKLLGIEVDMKY